MLCKTGATMDTDTVRRVRKDAVLSNDGLYRFRLSRYWGDGELMAWLMLGERPTPRQGLAVLLCIVGVMDDCNLLRGRHKLLGQIAAVSIVIV